MINGGVKRPAELFSRVIPKKIYKKVFAADDSFFGQDELRIPLKRAGWQDGLLAKISGGFTGATATLVFKPKGPWNLFKRITFEPQGYQKVIDVDGDGLHMCNLVTSHFSPGATGYERDAVGLDASTGVNVPRSKFPTAVGAQTYELWFYVPFTRTATDPTGALYIPHPQNTELVLLPAAAKGEIVTTAANLTVFGATIEVWQMTYSRPPKDDTVIPFGRGKALVITIEDREDATKTGENEIVYPRGGKLLHAFHKVVANAVTNSADVESLTLDLDGIKVYDKIDRNAWDYLTLRRNRNYPLPLGVIHFNQDDFGDFDGAAWKLAPDDLSQQALQPSQGRWIHLDTIDDKAQAVIDVASGATVVAADRVYSTFRRIRPIEVSV